MGSGGPGAGEAVGSDALYCAEARPQLQPLDRGWLVLVPGCTAAALPWYFG